MIRDLVTPYFRRARRARKGGPDSFLGRVSGVVHVGANAGQERKLYASLGLRRGAFPIAERIHDEVLSLPIGPALSLADAERVAAAVIAAAAPGGSA